MIFPILRCDSLTQVGDKVRIDASASFISPDEEAITLVEIRPTELGDYIDVTLTKILDWVYGVAEEQEIALRITTDGAPVEITKQLTILSQAEDKLFSNDKDLIQHESDIYNFLPKGYSSFNHVHRSAQTMILDTFMQRGIYKSQTQPLTKENVFNVDEVRQWSKFLVLSMIFTNASNEVGDYFATKAQQYRELSDKSASRAFITLDTDEDGEPDMTYGLTSGRLVRR